MATGDNAIKRMNASLDRIAVDANPAMRSVIELLREASDVNAGTVEERMAILKEGLNVETLTDPSVIAHTRLYQHIKTVLSLLESPIAEGRWRLCLRVFDAILADDDRAVSESIVVSISPRSNPQQPDNVQLLPRDYNERRKESTSFQIAKAMGTRFRDQEKYSGTLEDAEMLSFLAFRDSYVTAIEELDVPHDSSRVDLLHHALKGIARDFFFKAIRGHATQLATAFAALQDRFLNESVKLEIRSRLISMKLSDIQEAGDLDKRSAVQTAHRRIYALTMQGHVEYQTDQP
jgi:hypothetical protein